MNGRRVSNLISLCSTHVWCIEVIQLNVSRQLQGCLLLWLPIKLPSNTLVGDKIIMSCKYGFVSSQGSSL